MRLLNMLTREEKPAPEFDIVLRSDPKFAALPMKLSTRWGAGIADVIVFHKMTLTHEPQVCRLNHLRLYDMVYVLTEGEWVLHKVMNT